MVKFSIVLPAVFGLQMRICQWIREASCWWKQNKIQGGM